MTNLKIYIVEDNAIEMGGFRAMLEELGYDVIGYSGDGEEAVRSVLSLNEKPDVILMDINLPRLDGLAVAKKINEKCFIPVIIITGYTTDDNSDAGDYIYGYIQKPTELHELDACIKIAYNRAMNFRRTRAELAIKAQELKDRKVIERAKGILMKVHGCSELDAMRSLQKRSRDNNMRIAEIARQIVESGRNLGI